MADFSFTEDDLQENNQEENGNENQQIPPSHVAEDANLEGAISVRHGLEIAGHFNGDLHSHSKLTVLKTGSVEGRVDAFDVKIEGQANLSLTARKCLEIQKGGRFIGTLELQPEIIRLSEFAVFGDNEQAADSFHQEFTRDRSKKLSPDTTARDSNEETN
ncbi:hypothetical protein GF373_05135 [bacterium]|nr:hypothetical protein [bacterium]